ncbi:MAG: DUF4271 domain-containing protein [Flavobacteriaceae bacterium]|nr:DUF4271 domain-containing protein [Flavobacteriaceae bacterium]
MQNIHRTIESLDWITFILVGCVILVTVLRVVYPKRFDDFIKLPISNNYFLTKGKFEELKHPFSVLFFLIQVLTLSLFIFLFFLEKRELSATIFIKITLASFTFILIKTCIEKLIGSIFDIETIINNYIFTKLSYRNFISLFLIVLNFIFYFSVEPTMLLLFIFSGFIVLLNLFILFINYKNYRSLIFSNFFYFLLYICALEISPYLILYKVIV